MQQEMLSAGPINAAFFVFSDFFSYKNGTYFRTPAAYGPMELHMKTGCWALIDDDDQLSAEKLKEREA